MATRTSVANGVWSSTDTWDTGVPLDGDDVVIASGHTVTFNVDQSAFTTGVGITITGTLNHTTTTGVYVLKAKTGASIVGAGTWNIGTSATPIPFAAKHTITGVAGWYVDGNAGLTMTVYGAEPSIKYVKLSGDEAIGQTELSVDTDVTGDIWAVGDIIRIDDINKAVESEERVIAAGGIAAGAITVTAGLTAAKSTGAFVSLITRNVKIIAVGTGTRTIYRVGSTANKLTIGSGMFYGVNKFMFDTCHYMVINGGSYCSNSNMVYASQFVTVNNGVITNSSNWAFAQSNNLTINGGSFTANQFVVAASNNSIIAGGTFSGNTYVLYQCGAPIVIGGTFSGNGYGAYICTFANFVGVVFISNTQDLANVHGRLFDVELTSTSEHINYTSLPLYDNTQSEDHDGVDGAFKAWCKGGVVTSQTAVKPTGYTQAYLLDPESAIYPVFFTKQFNVEPGKTVGIEVQLRKDASMTYLPRVYLMASIGNPLAGATPVDTFTMTDSTDTWETDTFSITNSTDYDQDYTLWFVAQNASGNAYAAYDITTAGGAGGAVSIKPIQGMVGL